MTPRVTIFIPTHNDVLDLAECLESLRRLAYPRQALDVVVWDNASTDGTAAMVDEKFAAMAPEGWKTLRRLGSARNEGSYVPYNLALPSLSPDTDYVLGLDADVELEPDALTRLVDTAARTGAAVVGARSVHFDEPGRLAHAGGAVNRWTARYAGRDGAEAIACDYVIACCWLLDLRVLREVGGFDPDFFVGHWEVEYCLRLKTRGRRVVYEPRAVARHKIPVGGTRTATRLYYTYRNKLLVVRKSRYFPLPRLTGALAAALSLVRIVAVVVRTGDRIHARQALRGVRDGVRGVTGPRR